MVLSVKGKFAKEVKAHKVVENALRKLASLAEAITNASVDLETLQNLRNDPYLQAWLQLNGLQKQVIQYQ